MNEEYDQHLRAQDEHSIQDLLKLPHIPVSHQECASAIGALRRLQCASCAPCAAPCLCFEAESAISKDSEEVEAARMRMD